MKAKTLLSIVVILLLGVIGWLLLDKFAQEDTIKKMSVSVEEAQTAKDSLKNELTALLEEYEQMKAENEEMKKEIEQEKERIKNLLAEISRLRNVNVSKYRGQIDELKSNLEGYTAKIDSLQAVNQKLVAENEDIKSKFSETKTTKEKLKEKNEVLEEKVEMGSTLRAIDFKITGYNRRGKVKDKARRVDKLRICFTVGHNPIAEPGDRNIYVRLADTRKKIMTKSKDKLFEFQGSSMAYTEHQEVAYTGEDARICFDYKIDDKLESGTYFVTVFTNNYQMGTTTFKLD